MDLKPTKEWLKSHIENDADLPCEAGGVSGGSDHLSEDVRELLMAIENAARMAEQGILSADGGQCAAEIRSLVPLRFRTALSQ